MLQNELSNPRSAEFKRLAGGIEARAARHAKKVKGYASPRLPLFSAQSFDKQDLILASLRLTFGSLEAEEGDDFFEAEKRALWKSISLLGLVPPSDLFNELKPDRAIEIFDLAGGLIWRNLTCMDLCSYSLEEIACIDVLERYERDPAVHGACVANVMAMINGATPDLFDPNIKPYRMVETSSAERLILSLKHELCAVLKDKQGQIAAWLVTSDATVVGKDLPLMEAPSPIRRLSIVP